MPFEPFDLSIFAMCRSSSPRAYALRKLPCEVTRNIDSFRDFQLEAVMKVGGTPSALAMKGYRFRLNCQELPPHGYGGSYGGIGHRLYIKSLDTNTIRRMAFYEDYTDWLMLPEVFRRTPHTFPIKRVRTYPVHNLEKRGFMKFRPPSYYEVDSD